MNGTSEPTITPNPSPTPPVNGADTSSNVTTTGGGRFNVEQQTHSNTKDIEKLKQDLTNERLNNITVFGIFASLVTFLSVEIPIFKNIENFWLLIGLTSFLVSSMLLFIFSIHSVARDRLKWKEFFQSPILWLFLLFLIFSFVIFLLNSKGINIELKVNN
ncbi:MAG: hypothetical protein V1763_01980 [Parcubacteria group bacterium]